MASSQEPLILRSADGDSRGAPRRTQGSAPAEGLAPPTKRVCVGVVAGAHGVRGAVRIKSFTAEPKDVARYGPLEDEAGQRQFKLHLAGAGKGVVVARINGVADRDQAEAL